MKHIEHKSTTTKTGHGKADSWLKGGKLVHHKPGFFKDHVAGTFHHAHHSSLSLPSDHVPVLKILP
jgi:hypothetical protein